MNIAAAAPPLSLADLEAHDPGAKGRGPERRARCPFCLSDERAFHYNTETLLYNCKRASCGVKGAFTELWQGQPFKSRQNRTRAALRRSCALPDPATAAKPPTAETWREHCLGYTQDLPDTPGAAYLERRGIGARFLPTIACGCLYHPKLYNRPAVVFPFRDQGGKEVAIQARFIDDKPNGHLSLGPKSLGAFYTDFRLWEAPVIAITEAPIDALSLARCGVPAVALGGTEPPHWLLEACVFKGVLLATDNDANEAGDKVAAEIAPQLRSYGAKVARLKPAQAKDWNELLLLMGARWMRSYLAARLFYINRTEFHTPMEHSEWWPFVSNPLS